ncbi:MAG: hypothetical protein N2314_03495 [Brevinematales bacterium]|nr:hypothetical protein [Brevinematales bacterium]
MKGQAVCVGCFILKHLDYLKEFLFVWGLSANKKILDKPSFSLFLDETGEFEFFEVSGDGIKRERQNICDLAYVQPLSLEKKFDNPESSSVT